MTYLGVELTGLVVSKAMEELTIARKRVFDPHHFVSHKKMQFYWLIENLIKAGF